MCEYIFTYIYVNIYISLSHRGDTYAHSHVRAHTPKGPIYT